MESDSETPMPGTEYYDIPPPAPETPPRTPPPPTGTIQTALIDLQTCEALSDVTLISNGATRHPAVRALLACRSPYFRNLLFGDFQESRSRDVKLDFSPDTIRDLLTFFYTDTCPLLERPIGGADSPEEERINPLVTGQRLVELVIAADYLAIPELSRAACARLFEIFETSPEVACAVVEVAPASLALHDRARAVIRQRPTEALGVLDSIGGHASHGSVKVLSCERLSEVLSDRDIFASDAYLFKVLKFWASAGGEDRRLQACKLSDLINLERCRPSFLRDFVRPSRLVSEERLTATFEQQALEAERGRALFHNLRGGSVFSNGGKVLEATDKGFKNYTLGPWLAHGKHEWTFWVDSVSSCLWFGFAASRPVRSWAFFARENTGWAVSASGDLTPDPGVSGPSRMLRHNLNISSGETVTVILNLTKTGSVTVSTTSSLPLAAFSGLRQYARRLIPTVCVSSPAKIELVQERHYFS